MTLTATTFIAICAVGLLERLDRIEKFRNADMPGLDIFESIPELVLSGPRELNTKEKNEDRRMNEGMKQSVMHVYQHQHQHQYKYKYQYTA